MILKGETEMSKESRLLQPIQVGNLTLKNRIMFPPLTTGYEERDGSIGQRSLAFGKGRYRLCGHW